METYTFELTTATKTWTETNTGTSREICTSGIEEAYSNYEEINGEAITITLVE